MCEPISASTMAIMSIASTVASVGMGVMGQIQQGNAAQAQAGYQSAVMRNNQMTADMMADDAGKRGEIAEAKKRERTRQILGTQTAALAGQGTEISGSALDILGDTAASGEFDALTIRSNAAREAWGYKARSSGFAADAAKPGPRANLLGIGASLIGGAGSVADKWYRFI